MAPTKPVAEHQINRTPEYEEFIEKLRVFHLKRGTPFDPEPKMGNMNVDLLQLYKFIVEHGGYDKVSEEKLMWRKMCEGLGLMRHNAPADAYTLKQIFYRQLAAYEIKREHGKEPPPPEILEHTTAKGGSLLTRTLENFQARVKAADKEESGDDGTPSRERRAEETPTSSRASRGLREAPAPRVIFHPDTNPSRPTRHASSQQAGNNGIPGGGSSSHTAGHSSHSQGSQLPPHSSHHQMDRGRAGASFRESFAWPGLSAGQDIANPTVNQFQLPGLQQMPLRIVDTPSSNPDLFARKQRLMKQAQAQGPPSSAAVIRSALPAGILDGPNIYERCLFSLRSSIRSEQAFGLNHLVKISYERGDKYKFSQFSGLAEGLTEFALGVGSLFYCIDWTICNDPEVDEFEEGELDGVNGSSDILERIARLKPKPVQDNFQPAEFTDHLTLVTEAVLTIRNMVMLPENAWFMSEYMPLKDLLCILLHLPDMDVAVELKHSALDIAEQITPYLVLSANDPLYKTLLDQLSSTDRGTILTALRAVSRIAMNHPTETNKLSGVPPSVLRNLMDWLLLNDDELMDACLDFLYQYTAIVSNLDTLLQATNMEHLVSQLVRLLSHGAKRGTREWVVSDASLRYDNEDNKSSDEVHSIPKDLLERLLAMEEPERCYQWLRCFFEEDPESNVTQIAVWQAYNNAFLEPLKKKGRGMINAAEFIRNISTVYQAAGAQIVREVTPQGEQQRFIIRGIRARQFPTSPEGRSYFQCLWKSPGAAKCSVWNLSAAKMWEHILQDHLGEHPNEDDKQFKNREGTFTCHWGSCRKYPEPTKLNLFQFMSHIKTHVTTEEATYANAQTQAVAAAEAHTPSSRNKRPKPRVVEPAKTIQLTYEETASVRDERNPQAPPQAAGIPLSAVLILRNIARNVGKTEAEEALTKQEQEARESSEAPAVGGSDAVVGYKERLFRPVMGRLWEVFTENRLLAKDLSQLLQLLGA
ncbi:hypothetical protein B0T16DRAFT_357665 [Cercophora newfieldiana]|uniref:Chromatin structure-remodeling complex subunit rsc9 n=1 Tax=Cercophora newfieldiana TaxID=92897 RepID=A0AA40CJI6_9PEZI|nr:hypothetical protein B0T16DRAFT_357665 [Cercophora newfieldiana]